MYFKITNNTNRDYEITRFEIKNTINDTTTLRAELDVAVDRNSYSSSQSLQTSALYANASDGADITGTLNPNESVTLGYTLTSDETYVKATATYYLRDVQTGVPFTNTLVQTGITFTNTLVQ